MKTTDCVQVKSLVCQMKGKRCDNFKLSSVLLGSLEMKESEEKTFGRIGEGRREAPSGRSRGTD